MARAAAVWACPKRRSASYRNGDHLAFFWFPDAGPSVPGVSNAGSMPGVDNFVTAHGSMNHLAFNVPLERFDEYRERLIADGVEVSGVLDHDESDFGIAREFHDGVFVRSFYFRDPDGILLEFASWTREMGRPADTLVAPYNADGQPV
ncbi:MAG TPA: VOC family protein [Ilumatobacter sp.]|nr:VOC family protein [Ilumatobacter sp.]